MFDYQKNYSIAISYYKLSSKKNYPLSSFNLGCIYMDKHKINKSLNYFNKLSDEDIKMKEILKLTYINRIVLLYKSNNIESKIENINKNINKRFIFCLFLSQQAKILKKNKYSSIKKSLNFFIKSLNNM